MTTSALFPSRLHGRILLMARLAWVMIAFFYLGTFAASLRVTFSDRSSSLQLTQQWSEDETRSSLAQLGLTVEAYQKYDILSSLVITLIYFGMGIFLFWRRSDDWMAILFSVFFLTFPGTTIFGTLAKTNPGWLTVQAINDSLTSINFITLIIFPDGHFVPRWNRWLALGYIGIQGWRLIQPQAYQLIELPVGVFIFLWLVASQIYRYRRTSTPIQRQQTKWVVYGLAIGLLPLLVYLTLYLNIPALSQPGAPGMLMFLVGNLLWLFSLVCVVLSVALAILRSRLWDIDLIIRKTIQYSILTSFLVLVYSGSVILGQRLFDALTGTPDSALVLVVSTLIMAALFNPLRLRVQDFIDRRFFRRKYNALQTLAGFTQIARDESQLDTLVPALLSTVQDSLQPEQAWLWLKIRKKDL